MSCFACCSLASGVNLNYVAIKLGHANSQIVYLVKGKWMYENSDEQESLISGKVANIAQHISFLQESGVKINIFSASYITKPACS